MGGFSNGIGFLLYIPYAIVCPNALSLLFVSVVLRIQRPASGTTLNSHRVGQKKTGTQSMAVSLSLDKRRIAARNKKRGKPVVPLRRVIEEGGFLQFSNSEKTCARGSWLIFQRMIIIFQSQKCKLHVWYCFRIIYFDVRDANFFNKI